MKKTKGGNTKTKGKNTKQIERSFNNIRMTKQDSKDTEETPNGSLACNDDERRTKIMMPPKNHRSGHKSCGTYISS